MTTIRDIAEKLEISSATVSRALNNDPRISERTKNLVFAKAEELGYPVKLNATKCLKNTIGIIAPEIVSANLSTLVNSIVVNLKSKGFTGILGITSYDKETEKNWFDYFQKVGVSGIIIIMYNDEETSMFLRAFQRKTSIPIMQINNYEEYSEYDLLIVSERLAAIKAVEHLQELGHRDIAILTDVQAEQRAVEIQKAAELRGMAIRKGSMVVIDDVRYEAAGYKAMQQLYAKGELPTAVLATYDYLAFGIIRFCHEMNIDIPKDISLISIDNVGTSAYLDKALTTVSMPTEDTGRISTRILTDRIKAGNNKPAVQHVILNPELVVRETTAAPSR